MPNPRDGCIQSMWAIEGENNEIIYLRTEEKFKKETPIDI